MLTGRENPTFRNSTVNFFLTAVCLVVCVYVVYQTYRTRTIANKQLFEVKKIAHELQICIQDNQIFFRESKTQIKAISASVENLSEQFESFVSENEVSFGSVEREIDTAKNELILLIKQDSIQKTSELERNAKKSPQLQSLNKAFAARGPTVKDDD